MTTPLTSEEREEYTRHIDRYLNSCDLETVTRKKVRQALQEAVDKDLDGQKTAIKHLIEERFDAISKATVDEAGTISGDSGNVKSDPEANGHTPSEDANDEHEAGSGADEDVEMEEATRPAKKKAKTESKRETSEDADARLAAELQAQEEKLARGRTTRGGNSKAKPTKKAAKPKTKAKSAKRVRDEDDSGMSGTESGAEKPKKKAGGGFQKPFNLSYPLAELCGESQLSRPQVVKKLWEHIKSKELQDPDNKREIFCDDAMQAIFKMPKVNMFSMNKYLGKHLYPVEEP